jgi:hypothetical protein
MKRCLRLSPILSLGPLIGDDKLVAFSVGPGGVVYLVVALKPLDYRWSGWASFAKTVPNHPQSYRVIGIDGPQVVLNVAIEGERFNVHDVQPLPNELLLVCARSYYRGRDDFDRNGRVYTQEGQFAREILLGDGIESVQVTSKGAIWTRLLRRRRFWQLRMEAAGRSIRARRVECGRRETLRVPSGRGVGCDL